MIANIRHISMME